MTNILRKYLIVIAIALIGVSANAQDEVAFEFSDGISDATLKAKMERNVANLLTMMNKSATNNSTSLNFAGIDITDDAANALAMTWENVHMRTFDDDIVQHCLSLKSQKGIRGYEVQNIAVEMIPIIESYNEQKEQEITISFNKQGVISDFVISMGIHQYTLLLKDAKSVDDMDKRMQILHYVEQFRTAYCQKDIKFMDNIFSDDALIITGRIVQRMKSEIGMKADVEYTTMGKQQYLKNLKSIFTSNGYINVDFSEVTVERNGAKPNIYGVTCVQNWTSSRYHDEGIVFMLWDFTDEDNPKIHVRTWQPMEDTNRFTTKSFKL